MTEIPVKIIKTQDGSHSLYNIELNESYHSHRGAEGESKYVFIETGLNHWLNSTHNNRVRIFEVGFGTGLNAWLTYLRSNESGIQIFYHTVETFPVPTDIYLHLNYAINKKDDFLELHECPWNKEIQSGDFRFLKSLISLEEIKLPDGNYDVIYFDAFAPGKQPEIWSIANLRKCFNALASGGILVTYCAQGQFKRDLRAVGFQVETLPGALGKKEMVRAVKETD
jgi:tRNA U34 5-methylaminomethyl-2-thiouridine-forming methyltransferase MnmC